VVRSKRPRLCSDGVGFQFLSLHYTIQHGRLRLPTIENVGSQFLSLRYTTPHSRQLQSTTGRVACLFLSPTKTLDEVFGYDPYRKVVRMYEFTRGP
jgi:hypothetical protein